MIHKVAVHLIAVLNYLLLLGVSGHSILELFIELFNVSFEIFLQAFSESISLLPYLKFCLEVSESLADHLDV